MAIIYDWYENPQKRNKGEEAGLHPRPCRNGKRTMEALCKHIQDHSALSRGNVLHALDALVQLCVEDLLDGKEIHIEGLGYFSPTLEATERVTRSTKNKQNKVRLKTVNFRPDIKLKNALSGAHFRLDKQPRSGESPTATDIDTKLTEYFEEHSVITRYTLQHLCQLPRTTANSHLRRLKEEGKLRNIGRPTQPVYEPVPGYYGRSKDVQG